MIINNNLIEALKAFDDALPDGNLACGNDGYTYTVSCPPYCCKTKCDDEGGEEEKENNFPDQVIVLISSDRDFIQLQIDRPVTQYDAKGEMVLPKIKRGNEVFSLTPQQALLIKIISGDSSDNIKPIKPKTGEITAYKYITEKSDAFKKMLKEDIIYFVIVYCHYGNSAIFAEH